MASFFCTYHGEISRMNYHISVVDCGFGDDIHACQIYVLFSFLCRMISANIVFFC